MTSLVQTVLLILTYLITQNETANILAVFPTPSISHQVIFRPLTQELAKRGHKVTVVTADPVFEKGKTPNNFTEIDVHDASYSLWEKLYKITSTGDGDLNGQMAAAFSMLVSILEYQLKLPEVQKLIKEAKFDLILVEACVKPAIVLSHVFNAPLIQFSSLGFINYNVDTVGASWHPLLYPDVISQRIYNLTNWEKIKSLWKYYKLENIMHEVEEAENAMVKRLFGPNTPTMRELLKKVDMLFLATHPVWENNRPIPPNVVYLWGILDKPAKELPTDLKNYFDSSKNGVIYMSLGTNVKPSLLPPEQVQIIVRVFSQLPYDIIWKWDQDELPGRTGNILISKWVPQKDLLRHPKLKLFITQGGLQSSDEAISAGVPLIGMPMLGDQWYNVEQYEHHKIGVNLDIISMKEETFLNAINTVIEDPSYRRNVVRLRELLYDDPMKPLDRAVWWTEYVIRHGGASHLRAPAAKITWRQYLELDLIVTVSFFCTLILTVVLLVIFKVYKCLCKNKKNSKIKNKTN